MAAYDNEDVLLLFDDYESRLEKRGSCGIREIRFGNVRRRNNR